LASHADFPVEHIVTSSFLNTSPELNSTLMVPVHYVVVDKMTASVVVSLRGTLGLSDIITDIKANYVHYKYGEGMEGYAHSGMFHCAETILNSGIKESVSAALNDNPGFSLVLTGHSLGGSRY
jgi:Lipase (class 3)